MNAKRTISILGMTTACAAIFAVVSPAAAGRCGHSYAVDAPTTLVEVARQCNVNLSELYEANPGVDPRYVRPGERLAVPDEIDIYSAEWNGETAPAEIVDDDATASNHPYIVSYDYAAPAADVSGAYWTDATPQPVSAKANGSTTPLWLQPGAASPHASESRLSYQQLSALRIHQAGYVAGPVVLDTAALPPDTELVQCRVLRNAEGDDVTQSAHKLTNVFSASDGAYVEIAKAQGKDGFDCTLMSDASGLVDGVPAARFNSPQSATTVSLLAQLRDADMFPTRAMVKGDPSMITVSGNVVGVDNGCAVLKTAGGDLWRVSAQEPSDDLAGKYVVLWGRPAKGGACGAGPSLAISHAVYAEPWKSAQ